MIVFRALQSRSATSPISFKRKLIIVGANRAIAIRFSTKTLDHNPGVEVRVYHQCRPRYAANVSTCIPPAWKSGMASSVASPRMACAPGRKRLANTRVIVGVRDHHALCSPRVAVYIWHATSLTSAWDDR